jgi:hypothetical protein
MHLAILLLGGVVGKNGRVDLLHILAQFPSELRSGQQEASLGSTKGKQGRLGVGFRLALRYECPRVMEGKRWERPRGEMGTASAPGQVKKCPLRCMPGLD